QYALSDPMRYLDPSGLSSHKEAPIIHDDADITATYAFLQRDDTPIILNTLGPTFNIRSPDPVETPILIDDSGARRFWSGIRLAHITTAGFSGGSNSPPVPGFADASSASNLFSLEVPRLNLLFPFVTNQVGFDTGLVIANTTLDRFETRGSSPGSCGIYFGSTTGSTPAPTAPSSPYVALSSTAGPNFQGYVIAQCQFQYAHGFAFISDLGARNLAQGYLALVLGDNFITPSLSVNESLGQ
ncbi:MAG: hypothetical protein ACRD44_01825, partial [Bryobacteraceae bacterium]